MSYLAVNGLTLMPEAPATGGTFVITSIPSTTVKVDNKGAFFGQLGFTVIGLVVGGLPQADPSPVPGVIVGTGEHMKDNQQKAVLEGDSVTIVVNVTSGASVQPTSVTIKISAAGQTSVNIS